MDDPRGAVSDGAQVPRLRRVDTSRLTAKVQPRLRPRGVPPALRDHLVFATSDRVEAEVLGRGLWGPHHLQLDAADLGTFHATWHAVRFRDITIGHLDYGTRIGVSAEELPPDWIVLVPMSGTASVITARGTIEATPIRAALPGPGPVVAELGPQTSLLVVIVDHEALVIHASRLLGRLLDHPLEFDLDLDLAGPSANRWNFAIQMLHAELYEPESLLHRGVGPGQLEEFLMSSLLYAHRSNYSDVLRRPDGLDEHRVTRAARDYIEVHLGEPLRVTTIAAAVGVSVRTLESALRTDLGTTPTGYVHNRRLERVRADLADAGPGATVTATTLRWGVTHQSRFATEYRTRFGESPSQTLRH